MGKNEMMRAVVIKEFGGPEQLVIGEVSLPQLNANEVLVKVSATALNRADTLQRKGYYPPPPGASEILGLEMAGAIVQTGVDVTTWEVGDRVMGLLAGGGYAEYVTIHEDLAIPVPKGVEIHDAAGIPEVWLTAFQAIVLLAGFQSGQSILIHAGASGVGTAAIQIARDLGAQHIFCTASSGKHTICKSLGADTVIDYKTENFEEMVLERTDKKGVDVIIDFLGASYFPKNLSSLGLDGRMVLLALMGGTQPESANLGLVLRKRLHIMGTTLRARSLDYKINLTRRFAAYALPKFESKTFTPVIDSYYVWTEVAKAHTSMDANKNKGKIILKVGSP